MDDCCRKFWDYIVLLLHKTGKLDGQRSFLCVLSVDIDRYDTCRRGCNYCYVKKGLRQSIPNEPKGELCTRKNGGLSFKSAKNGTRWSQNGG